MLITMSDLIEKNNSYEIDWDSFEECLKYDVKAFILCNPHNPGGKVWSKEDLTKMAALCQQYNVLVLSDEIHSDLIFKPNKHIPILMLRKIQIILLLSLLQQKHLT